MFRPKRALFRPVMKNRTGGLDRRLDPASVYQTLFASRGPFRARNPLHTYGRGLSRNAHVGTFREQFLFYPLRNPPSRGR